MDIVKCNQDLIILIEYRTKLKELSFSDSKYDEIEDVLGDLEDAFNKEYGDELEDVLIDIHDRFCPGVDVLLPTAYLAKKYFVDEENEGQFLVAASDGVKVELSNPEGDIRYGRVVLLPNPMSIRFGKGNQVAIVWRAK